MTSNSPRLTTYRLVWAMLGIFVLLLVLPGCGSEPKQTLDGNPVLSGNDKLVPTSPMEEPVKDTAQLHEMRKLTEAMMKQQKETGKEGATAPPPAAPTYTAPPPPPPPAPKPVDMSGVQKAVAALQNIDQLDQRANAAEQAASKAEQRTRAAQQAANIAESQAADKKCPELSAIRQETAKVEKAVTNASVRSNSARKSAGKVTDMTGDVRKKLGQINANMASSADANATIAMAQTAQNTYNKLLADLSSAEKEAEAAAKEAGNAETAAYNAKNIAAECKAGKTNSPPLGANKNKIKTNLEQNLMDLSRNPRNLRIISDIKEHFDNVTQKGVISTEKGKYSVEQYITKLNLSGAMDIQITDLSIDNDGKVSDVEIEETKLDK